jgi:hypothetical protein
MPKINYHTMGKKSPNLVTLIAAQCLIFLSLTD